MNEALEALGEPESLTVGRAQRAPIVVEHAGIRVVRDDLFPGGTKARYIPQLFADADELVYASPAQGGAQCSMAFVARALGKRATIFVAKRKQMHRRTLEAQAMGARIVQVDFGMLSNVQGQAKKYVEATPIGVKLAPFGMDIDGADHIIAQIARSTGEDPAEIWCASGSGLLARGLHLAWPKADLHHVIVGGRKTIIANTTAHEYPKPFEFAAEAPPFPSDPHYEAKAWEFCQELCGPGPVLFWNVTGESMLTDDERTLMSTAAAVPAEPPRTPKPARTKTRAPAAVAPPAAPVLADTTPIDGYQVQFRLVDSLRPYDRNARTHSDTQVEMIVRLITEYGWTNPILDDGIIRAGHGRQLAAKRIYARGGIIKLPNGREIPKGYVPVIDCTGWTEAQKKAYVLADNQSALAAGWDNEILTAEMLELKAEGFDLALTGFDDAAIVQFTDTSGDGQTDPTMRKLEGDERQRMNAAWRELMRDWNGFMDTYPSLGYLSTNFTKGALAVYFVRAQLFGTNIPRAATTPYTGHRFWVAGSKLPIATAFEIATKDDGLLESMIWQCQNRPAFDKMFGSLGIHGHRAPADFPATLAQALIDEFMPRKGGAVLDPCHGWGGRAIGFLLSKKASRYQGYDVDSITQDGVRRMANDLAQFCTDTKIVDLALCPFEDAKITPKSFDFALTSPPYFDVEKYNGDDQSWKRYPTFEEWVAGFYAPMIENVADAIKPGCAFALQIGNQSYPLEREAKMIAAECGLEHVETRSTVMVNNYTETKPEDGEVVVIFRRTK